MPEWAVTVIIGVASALFAGGGVAALIRARGQNEIEDEQQFSEARTKFEQQLQDRVTQLTTQVDALREHERELAARDRERGEKLARLEERNARQGEQLHEQKTLIDELRAQNSRQELRIRELESREAERIQQLQVEIAKNRFLETENNELRREIERLKGKLPPRVEVQPT